MVVLMEYSPGLAMKRKGGEEPGLFSCSGDGDLDGGVPVSCRATKIRRLESSPGGYHHDGVLPPEVASVGEADDVMMGEAQALSLSPGPADEDRAMVVFDPADDGRGESHGLWRSLCRQWAPLRAAGAEWHGWIRDMLREADSRTVRELLSSAQGEGAGLAVVPWGAAATAPASMDQKASTATEEEEEDTQGTAAMDVEVEEEMGLDQTPTPGGAVAGCREGRFYLWPQHCMPTPPLPAVPQASSVMCSL